jgi:hypothetical protein
MIGRQIALLLSISCATTLNAQGLFRDTVPLQITIVTNLRALVRDRDSTRLVERPASLTYQSGAAPARTVAVTVRPRGHFRRQARNCDFPPLKLEISKELARGTLFQGNGDLKITTTCKPGNSEYEQYILAEFAMYRAYQLVSPLHFRTRLARITYQDSLRTTRDVVSWAFLIEDEREVAQRFKRTPIATKGALFRDVDATQLAITSLFELMVANTDWSISGLHNVSLLRDTLGTMGTVAFDFDWSGAVHPRYATPDTRLGIRSVAQRLYRGPCMTVAEWQPVVARFIAARPQIDAMLGTIPDLDPARRQKMQEYFGEFYRTVADARGIRQSLVDNCLADGN